MLKEHDIAAATLITTAKTELAATITPPIKRRGTVTSPSSTSRRPRSLIMDSMMTPAPSRTAPSAKPRRRSSGGALYDSPLDHLLGELALNVSQDSLPSQQVEYLSATLAERGAKTADVTRNAQSSFEKIAASQLTDARVALQLIRDSVLAESPFVEVHLVDPGIDASIRVLAQEVHNVASRLEGVEREGAVLARGRNLKREDIISRWGGSL